MRQTIDSFGNFGRSRKEPLDGTDVSGILRTTQRQIGFIGENDFAVCVGDEQAFGRSVGQCLGDIIARFLSGEIEKSRGISKQSNHAANGEQGEQTDGETSRVLLWQERERGRRTDQQQRQHEHKARTA